ncbi:MAG: FkbM family methyltransferase [Deltaproteobacteria bacterium]|nr:FkbM family methyltransferase [Deltaproteobacteria bacterium]
MNGIVTQRVRPLWAKTRFEGARSMARAGARFARYGVERWVLHRTRVIRRVHDYCMGLNIQVPGISKTLAVYGVHEKLETGLMRERLRPGMTAIDVGANIGYYALLEATLVGPKGLVYALEPFPRNYDLLVRNIRLNRREDRIHPFRLAAGDAEGMTRMYLGPSDNMHCLMEYDRTDTFNDHIEVETVTLDRFLEGRRPVDFLRMDLEGYECQVLDGMQETLRTVRPDLLFEIHPVGDVDPDPRYTPYLERLLDLGYRPLTLICPGHERAATRFAELGYRPSRVAFNGLVRSVRFDGIRPEDLLKVAARRPKITRAIYWTAEGP